MYAFPMCNDHEQPLPLCYEDCLAIREQFCYNDWAHIEDNKLRGIYFQSRGHFDLPVCENLPKYDVKDKSASCFYAKLLEMNEEEVTCKFSFNCNVCCVKDNTD